MEHEEYVERFRGSAMKRAKLVGLKRNAAALKQQPTNNYSPSAGEKELSSSVDSD
jgi:hypothetical protein